jgi:murein DD-endopeptidase MepM/ murein hydrolase activator NlpD
VATATGTPASLRLGGVTYRTPDQARVGAETIEHDAEERADAYRANGDEALAERVMDRASEQADRLRTWAREREEADAAGTVQPSNRPRSPRSSGSRTTTNRRRSPSPGSRRRGGSASSAARAARRDVGRGLERTGLEPYTSGAADLGWTFVGMALGLSVLFLLLRGRGPAAVEGIIGGATAGFARFLDPGDPFLLPKSAAAVPAVQGAGAGVESDAGGRQRGRGGTFNGKLGRIIGRPYEGTHARGEGPDNWQSDNAYDIALPVGTPLYAVSDGVLGNTGPTGEGGRFAGSRINLLGATNDFFYGHLSRLAPGIVEGAHVRKGQLLGYSGSANGVAHLHFASRTGDPFAWLKSTYNRLRSRRRRTRATAGVLV